MNADLVSTVVPAVGPSVSVARRFVRATLIRWGCSEELVETALLLTSELVTNAFLHAQSPSRVQVRRSRATIRVEVLDRGSGRAELRTVGPDDSGGRGLQIVEALADRWGDHLQDEPDGHVVWFELDETSSRVSPAPKHRSSRRLRKDPT